jgi:hypothetical protein
MFARPPSPGLLGAAADVMRYLAGANLAGQILLTLLFPLPLPLSAATHAGVLWLTSNAAGFCATPVGGGWERRGRAARRLCFAGRAPPAGAPSVSARRPPPPPPAPQMLSHPLSRERARLAAGVLDFVAALPQDLAVGLHPRKRGGPAWDAWRMPSPAGGGSVRGGGGGGGGDCRAMLVFVQLSVFALPLLAQAWHAAGTARAPLCDGPAAPGRRGRGAAGGAARDAVGATMGWGTLLFCLLTLLLPLLWSVARASAPPGDAT